MTHLEFFWPKIKIIQFILLIPDNYKGTCSLFIRFLNIFYCLYFEWIFYQIMIISVVLINLWLVYNFFPSFVIFFLGRVCNLIFNRLPIFYWSLNLFRTICNFL